MKAYKGFNKDMTCRYFQFEEGKEYEHEGKVNVCESGFHACERPLDCFYYYNPASSVYHEVEVDGDISKADNDTKVAAKKIKIGARLDIAGLVQAQFEYVKEHTTTEHTDPKTANAGDWGAANAGYRGAANAGDYGAAKAGNYGAAKAGNYGAAKAGNYGAANAGDWGAANAGYRGAANAGDWGAAKAGNYGAANAGDCGAANAGNYGAANAGDWGAANAGDRGAANAGDRGAANAGDRGAANAGNYGAANAGDRGAAHAGNYGAANAGDYGAAVSRGSASVGKSGVAIARGDERNQNKVKGGIGAILVIALEPSDSTEIIEWKAAVVDGEKIKADTWYFLKDGELVEAEDVKNQ